jgi:16S rRNA (adenine1518-N6/adenine1519-N6)-dimethyltransferase
LPKAMQPATDLMRLMRKYHIALRAELDQEHIVDRGLIYEMVDVAEVGRCDVVLEVGAGMGNITDLVGRAARHVYAIERYRQFEPILRARLKGRRNIDLIFANALNMRLPSFTKIVSNPPFSICEGLLQKLIHSDFKLGALIVPLSFAQTITAEGDDPKASKLSILASAFYGMKLEKAIEPDAFYPAPDFRCALLKLMPFATKDLMTLVTRHIFLQRDKKSKNALRKALIDARGLNDMATSKLEAKRMVEALNLEPGIGEARIGALSKGQILRIIGALRSTIG